MIIFLLTNMYLYEALQTEHIILTNSSKQQYK